MTMQNLIDLKTQMVGKQLVGYGAGLATVATLQTTDLKLSALVDDNPELHGQTISGIPIRAREYLNELDPQSSFIVVFAYTGKAIRKIEETLYSLGFEFLKNWVDCSFLHFESIRHRLGSLMGIRGDPEFFTKVRTLSLYSTLENQSTIAGTWLFGELLEHIHRMVPGNIAEMGVYRGGECVHFSPPSWRSASEPSLSFIRQFRGIP